MSSKNSIDDSLIEEARRVGGHKTKKEAVVTALMEFNRRRRAESLIAQFGTFEDFMTQDELRRMREEG